MVDTSLDSRIAEAAAVVEALRRESASLDRKLELQAAQVLPNGTTEIRPSTAVSVQDDVPSSIFWAPQDPAACLQQPLFNEAVDTQSPVLKDSPALALHNWEDAGFSLAAVEAPSLPSVHAPAQWGRWVPKAAQAPTQPMAQCLSATPPLDEALVSPSRHAGIAPLGHASDPLSNVLQPLQQDVLVAPADESGFRGSTLLHDACRDLDRQLGVEFDGAEHAGAVQDGFTGGWSGTIGTDNSMQLECDNVLAREPAPGPCLEHLSHPSQMLHRDQEEASFVDADFNKDFPVHTAADDCIGHSLVDASSRDSVGTDGYRQEEMPGCAEVDSLARQSRAPPERSRLPVPDFPSDDAVAQMSRRERIALLERAESGTPGHDVQSQQGGDPAGSSCQDFNGHGRKSEYRGQARGRGAVQSAVADHEQDCHLQPSEDDGLDDAQWLEQRRQNRKTRLQGGAAVQSYSAGVDRTRASQPFAEDGLEDEEWYEQRRQSRKMRLQQHVTGRVSQPGSTDRCVISDCVGVTTPVSHSPAQSEALETNANRQPHWGMERKRASRSVLDSSGHSHSPHDGVADEVQAAHAITAAHASHAAHAATHAAGGRSLAEHLEDFVRFSVYDPRWMPLCTTIAAGVHKLSSGGLVRAIHVVADVSTRLTRDAESRREEHVAAFRAVVDAVLVCITPQLGSLSTGVIKDALAAMASMRIPEQSYLDMLLAQLLVLLRRECSSFTPDTLASIAGAIGSLHSAGVSAKRGGSGAGASANQRCLSALAEQIAANLESFGGDELGRMGGAYLVAFTDDVLRRALLARAANVGAGLIVGCSSAELVAMRDIECAVRKHSFAFIASLPDHTKDYLMKLKAADPPTCG